MSLYWSLWKQDLVGLGSLSRGQSSIECSCVFPGDAVFVFLWVGGWGWGGGNVPECNLLVLCGDPAGLLLCETWTVVTASCPLLCPSCRAGLPLL